MRATETVDFITESQPHYDPITGTWVRGDETVISLAVNVTDVTTERASATFGDVALNRKVIRWYAPLPAFDRVRISGTLYQKVTGRRPQNLETIIVAEMINQQLGGETDESTRSD